MVQPRNRCFDRVFYGSIANWMDQSQPIWIDRQPNELIANIFSTDRYAGSCCFDYNINLADTRTFCYRKAVRAHLNSQTTAGI